MSVFVDARGTGSPVILSHGAGADSRMFTALQQLLADSGFRAIRWDLPGHAGSHGPFSVSAALDALGEIVAGCDRPVLVGQSLGGNLSQEFVRRHPSSVRGLAIIGSAWNQGPLTGLDRLLLSLTRPFLRSAREAGLPQMMAKASAATPAGRLYAETAFGALSRREFAAIFHATTTLLDPDPAYRTPVPLLLMRGSLDRTGNISRALPRWAAAEGITEHVIDGAGHIANVDDPAAVARVLVPWLRTLEA